MEKCSSCDQMIKENRLIRKAITETNKEYVSVVNENLDLKKKVEQLDSPVAGKEDEVIELCSNMGVELVDSMGTDLTVVRAARVSFNKDAIEMGQSERGLLGFLIKNKHVSPLEHVQATIRFEVPIFVAREHMRHRVMAFNEWSGRYSQLRPKFYCPPFDRGIHQVGKPGAYKFDQGTDEEVLTIWREMRHSYSTAWNCYQYLLDQGIGKEVSRNCLPVGIYTSYFASANLRGWLNYLALRTTPDALFEIRQSAAKVETLLHTIAPHTLNLWDEYGRQSL